MIVFQNWGYSLIFKLKFGGVNNFQLFFFKKITITGYKFFNKKRFSIICF